MEDNYEEDLYFGDKYASYILAQAYFVLIKRNIFIKMD